jgi:hypothetical protein
MKSNEEEGFYMSGLEVCRECLVPLHVSSEQTWLNGGAIVQSRDSRNRMVFMECENFDPLFQGIEKIIGMPIERAVTAAKRKAVRAYLGSLVPDVTKDMLRRREIDWHPVNDGFRAVAGMSGYGKYEVLDFRHEQDVDDYIVETIREPYSVPLAAGDMLAAFEILFGCDLSAEYGKIGEDLYEIKGFVSDHPEELRGRLRFKEVNIKPGDIQLKRCKTCGAPDALSDYAWHVDRGVIVNRRNGRRMVLTGMELDTLFSELESELGDIIPSAVIEAQRRFVRKGFYDIEGLGTRGMREQLAVRGLGNILELKSNEKGLTIRIENSFLHLMVVGLVQGLYEHAFDVDTHLQWDLSDDSELNVMVTPLDFSFEKAATA